MAASSVSLSPSWAQREEFLRISTPFSLLPGELPPLPDSWGQVEGGSSQSPRCADSCGETDRESLDSWREPAMEPLQEEFDGVLQEEAVAEGLSGLGRSALGIGQVYLDLALPGRDLSDISILGGYVHLQKLDLSYNKINDLSCLGQMPFLLWLDASHNELTTLLGFEPPRNLKVVNFSHNSITEVGDLSAYKALTELTLSHNQIQEIGGLEKCISLTHLDLAHNKVSKIDGLANLPIKTLSLASNQIEKITGLEGLQSLRILDLSSNNISSFEGLEERDFLETIKFENNKIAELAEISYIEDLPLLRQLTLLKNPIQELPGYWLSVIFMLPRLTELDEKKITVEEKVAAVNKYNPPPEVIAGQDHMANIMYSMMQLQRVFDSTLPSQDAPYPMLVITGPQSCGKRELTNRLVREFKDFFRYGACHTTRNPYFGEEKRFDYHFVSTEMFEEMICAGKFILTMKYCGHYYGLSRDTIESIARDGLACCTHMEIEGVRSLKNSYFEPRYILLVPMNKEKYEGSLRRKGLFSRPEIELAVSRVDTYIQLNQDVPGFFDAVINADDLDDAYRKLSLLVKEYLGLTEKSAGSGLGQRPSLDKQYTDSSKMVDTKYSLLSSGSGTRTQTTGPNGFLDSAARTYSARVSAKLSATKNPLEEASIQRRQQAARQALVVKTPSTCNPMLQRATVTAPPTLGPQPELTDSSSEPSLLPSGSLVTQENSLFPPSPDTSSRDSRASSGLSMLSSAGAYSAEGSRILQTPIINFQLAEDVPIEPLDLTGIGARLDSYKGFEASEGTPETPRLRLLSSDRSDLRASKSKASSHHLSITSRPGSNTKPVLPPIPSGRKVKDS
ncbi:leucine-rich repeat and guanylate kinase domain-containing protein [Ambystoma mexicanum]|uniref:leucine-rich repeat and guanylate kinase domain-containing protein n=1 Tax=Ambystoma mexicanum TaxID=8296 RepID=UPI0037E95FE7